MINSKLVNRDYYLNKLSMFLKTSYGITDQIETQAYILQLIDGRLDEVKEFLDILNPEVFLKIDSVSTTESEILDMYAHLYGFDREFSVTYYDEDEDDDVTEVLVLTNFELWLVIKAAILQNYFDGSYGQAVEYYKKMQLPVYMSTTAAGEVGVILDDGVSFDVAGTTYAFTDNIKKLFLANVFTIQSMGIKYVPTIMTLASMALWDDVNNGWDGGLWSL